MDPQYAHCPGCAQDVPVEAPPCVDGHDDCPDRACMLCGMALIVGPLLLPGDLPAGDRHLRTAA